MERRRKKVQNLAGFEPTTFQFSEWKAGSLSAMLQPPSKPKHPYLCYFEAPRPWEMGIYLIRILFHRNKLSSHGLYKFTLQPYQTSDLFLHVFLISKKTIL